MVRGSLRSFTLRVRFAGRYHMAHINHPLRLTALIIGYERKALEEVAATTFHVWESHPVVHIKAAMEDRLMRPL